MKINNPLLTTKQNKGLFILDKRLTLRAKWSKFGTGRTKRMKVGDLVRLQKKIHHESGVYKPGITGIVVALRHPVPCDPTSIITVCWSANICFGCHQEELEVISESR